MSKSLILVTAAVLLTGTSFVLGGAYGPHLMGSGYLQGWTIMHDGEEICDSPYVWDSTKEIECN
jgi:hypothetical protein